MISRKIIGLIPALLLMLLSPSSGQDSDLYAIGAWRLQSLNGSVIMESEFRSQETVYPSGLSDRPESSIFSGEILLRSRSYVWHPNFMLINADFDFNPGIRRDQFLVVPNRTETKTGEKLNLHTSFFKQRPFTFNLFTNFSHSYVNREFLTNVENYRTDIGGGAAYRNDILPVTFSYSHENWEQKELQTGRDFVNTRDNFRSEFSKSFSRYDDHRLAYSYEDYSREYAQNASIHNKISSVNLRDNFFLDKNRNNNLNSLIWFYKQTGSDEFDRLTASENIRFVLPYNLDFSGDYRYASFDQKSFSSDQHNISGRIEHQLYHSLRSFAHYEYIDLNQSGFNQYTNAGTIGFNYIKKIPTGNLSIDYELRKRNENRNSLPSPSRIINEAATLFDGQTILLENPYADPASVLVTDETGLIPYQENLDYVLITRGDFLEIQRLPGGQIPDGTKILIDYTVTMQTSYQYDILSNAFGARLTVFNQLAELYFRSYEQDIENPEGSDLAVLKTVSERVFGTRLSKGPISGGVEIDDYNSNIVPYHSVRYYITFNRYLFSRLNVSLSGNIRNYTLTEDEEDQKFRDLTGRFLYRLSRISQISLETSYRFQDGRGIDLNLATLRGEFTTRFRQMYLTVGLETYRRDFSGEEITYNAGFMRVERKF